MKFERTPCNTLASTDCKYHPQRPRTLKRARPQAAYTQGSLIKNFLVEWTSVLAFTRFLVCIPMFYVDPNVER
jgi:hypothetical protein